MTSADTLAPDSRLRLKETPTGGAHKHPRQCYVIFAVHLATLVAFLSCAACSANADQIVIGDQNYPRARIVDVSGGALRFRLLDNSERVEWLDEIDRINVDSVSRLADLNEAEQYLADGEPNKAIVRYERALRVSEGYWSALVLARLAIACERAGLTDRHSLTLIRVARCESAGPLLAARLIPANLPTTSNAPEARALQNLNTAIRKEKDEAIAGVFRLYRFAILKAIKDPSSGKESEDISKMPIPQNIRCARAYEIQLVAFEDQFEIDATRVDLTSLDQAIAGCPTSLLPDFLMLKGETLYAMASTEDDIIRATWPFMRVAIHCPHHQKAANALYKTAIALERLRKIDKAIQLLEECLQHDNLSPEMKALAGQLLSKLESQ